MTQSTGRQDAIKAILGLVPPRSVDEAAALANLERLDDAALETMRAKLARSAAASGSKSLPVTNEGKERRALARAKLMSGFSKLEAATRMLEEHDRARAQPREQMAQVAQPQPAAPAPRRKTVAAPPKGASGRLVAQVPVPLTDTWQHPLIIGAGSETQWSAEGPAATSHASDREATVVPVSESVLVIDKLRSLIAKQLSGVLELSRVDEMHASQVGELFDLFLKDEVIDKYLHVQTTGMIRDILAMALNERLGFANTMQLAPVLRHFQSRLRAPSASIETKFLSTVPPVLAETTAIDGFAKMVVRMREYEPEIVVMIKGGGEIAGKLIQRTYDGSARFVTMDPTAGEVLLTGKLPSRGYRVLIVDDVARTGRTMLQGLEACKSAFGVTAIRGMALIGTVESSTILGDRAFFPTLSPDRSVSVPWSKEGQYHGTSKDHVLGWGKPGSLSIAKSLFARAVGRLVTS
ncbi:hypothetical protein [Methylobacterium sp. B1]|uniref:hypothetical protein n=1 Tax=Methylobacterium sp. B1 TaxID=91459 RepID=UPI0006885F75|nr:hypothetical protein [Methylobacterium sp. B1]